MKKENINLVCRYVLFADKDLTSRVLSQSNNKQELRKTRSRARYNAFLKDVFGEIYDRKTRQWIE